MLWTPPFFVLRAQQIILSHSRGNPAGSLLSYALGVH